MAPHPAFLLIDRTAALFCGVAAGIAIGLAFAPQLNDMLGRAPVAEIDGPSGPGAVPATAATPATPAAAPSPAAAPALRQSPPGFARAVAADRPFRIGVFGDSFGDGLWAALYNQLPRREAFQVLRFSQQATGFTRYRQTNLEERLAEQLAEGPVDVAVISFGANDTQGLWVNGKAAALLSPAWQDEVGARVTRYVEALKAQGASVVWIGLPVMRDAAYDRQVMGLNRFFARLMADLDVPFIDTRDLAAGAEGTYVTHLEDEAGNRFLARAGDGIHMSGKGYQRLTAALAGQLRQWGRAARNGEAVPDRLVPPPAPLPPRLAKPKLPVIPIGDPPLDTQAAAGADAAPQPGPQQAQPQQALPQTAVPAPPPAPPAAASPPAPRG